ncbi:MULTISPECIES: tandem large repeat [Vibrio]|uniref:tandem large repeat n=1 Tax=Vibrio TaxID=662 RepID=UPI001267C219|nr:MULTISPECIES: tandem large repeat [Vibrio]MDE3900028.1 tandem large repeat [Vibrio sp. CC007]
MQRHIGTMLVYKNIAKLFLTIIVILSLSSCGGGGGGDSSPRARDKGTISGIVFDAPVSKAVVTAYEYQNGKVGRKLGSATTTPYGEYSIEVDASSMPLYIEAKGGAYKDPLTDDIVETSEGKPIRIVSVINYGEGNDQDVMITPLTYMVTGLAEYKIKNGTEASSAIDDALNTINAMYGFNVNSVKPIDITRGGISGSASEGHRYGALLTAYSSYAYDFIDENGNAGNVYSSLNLSDIGYRDISADGYLDGQELDRTGSFAEQIYFGLEEVTPDTYTNQMAEHTLVVVSDPNLNASKTPIDDYLAMTEHLNALGTNGSADGAIPEREETVIDDQPPVATRSDEGVLKGIASIDVALTDAVGVKSASVTLRHKFDEGDSWSDFACSSTPNDGDICWVDVSEFVEGTRETSLTVYIDTEKLDPANIEQEPEAYLLIQATDVMGNSSGLLSGSEIPFEWDNIAPIIEITSAETINSDTETYVLKGLVKENPKYLKGERVLVSLSNGEDEPYLCTEIYVDEIWCEFETIGYLTENFGDKANFRVTAEDVHGNVGVLDFTLYNDNTPPTIYLTYPNSLFNVEDDAGDVYQIDYSDTTYNHESVESATEYLKVLYDYASKGLAATLGAIDPDLEFTDFIGQDLVDQSVPYVSATISDQSDGETYGSSAENLTLRVKYYSKKEGEETYRYHYTAEQVASDAVVGENKGIPFEKLEFEDDNTVPRMTYIIPYVKEVLGLTYGDKTSQDIQKLVISVLDASGNESVPEEVYYRTSFDMPEVTVVTPFIDAQVRLEGLSASGSFNYLNSCDTVQVEGQKDVASCTIPYDSSGYEFFRVYLGSKSNTHYYQWSLDQNTPVYIPASVNVGAYFSEVDKNTLYITEFSTYHTGLFDSQWNNLNGDEKTTENARLILDEVNSALDTQERSMLGFDPVTTEYATNRMLNSALPDPLTDKFIYRFLLESLTNMAGDNSAENSSTFDYASAFYRDLSYDGLANGEDKSGPIKIGNYTLSSDTYRNELAQGYYDVAHGIHGVESKVALEQADHFAKAYPEFADQNVFEDEGGSIDQQAPSVVVAPNEEQTHGSFTEVGNDTDYNISGIIHSKVTIEDIATVNDQQTVLSAYWIGNSKKKTPTSIEFTLNDAESTEYIKVYDFIINSLLPEYDGVEKFEIEATVEDGIGNSEGPYIASTYYVDNEPPVGSLTTVVPEYPTEADDVTVTLQFDEPVTAVAATFDDIDIDFGESKDFKELWTGTTSEVISLNPDENSKKLVVSAYHDELNNVGAEFTEDIIVTPVITIDDVTDNNIVDDEEDNVTDITFSGTTTGFLKDSELSVNVVSDKRPNIDKFEFTEVKVNQEGVWSISNQDMSSWEESDFTIEVTGRNSEESEYVTEDKPSRYVDSIAPEVIQSQISMSGSAVTLLPVNSDEVLIDGEIATVTLTFSERVSKPESLLNGQLITFNQPADGDVAKTWVGTSPELVLPESESTSKLVVTNYTDTAGEPNSGAPYEKTVDVKPIILISDIEDLTTTEATDFVVSGTARGFENNAQLRVVVSSDNPINEDEELNLTAKVTNGIWTTAPEDISSWESGTLTITVDGANDGGQAAEQASQEVVLEDDIEPKVNGITVNSGDPIIDNQTAFVSLTFSERVENVVANVDGVDVTFISRDAAKTVWEGTTSGVVTLNANEMFKTVTVTEYQDAQGNSGEEDSSEAPVKPVIEITERGDSIGEDESSRVVISGTARGFKTGDKVTVVGRLESAPNKHYFNETVDVAGSGTWNTPEQNIRDWPSGDINLTVVGQNNNGVAADSAKDTITYEDATPPTVDGEIVFSPEFPVDGQNVTITVNFSELVTGVTATVGGVGVTFTGDEPAQQWVGETEGPVTLSSNEDTITAVVNRGYQDLSGNEAGSDKETATGVKPVLSLDTVEDNNQIDSQEAEHVVIHGTGIGFAGDSQMITVTVTSQKESSFNWQETVSISEDGVWTTNSNGQDMSDWPLGFITVEVSGSNQKGIAAESVSNDKVSIVDTLPPNVTRVESLTPSEPEFDSTVSLTINFDEPVKELSGTFAGVPMNFTKVGMIGELSDQWMAETENGIDLTAGSATEEFILNTFEDASGNAAVREYKESFFVKPLIEIEPVTGDNTIKPNEINGFYITGQSKGIEQGGTLKVKVKQGWQTKYTDDVTVESNGSWSTIEVDGADWRPGEMEVQVTGINSGNVSADQATQTITIQ